MNDRNSSDLNRAASADQINAHPEFGIQREAWLFKNPNALASVQTGLKQSATGETISLGSFAKFAEDDLE